MADNNTLRDRRGRVRRIRNSIIGFVAVYLAMSMILMTVLCIKVYSLQRQIDILVGANSGSVTSAYSSSGGTSNDVYLVSGTAEGNLANPEDTLKVYLTFDDGPSQSSDAILDILDDYGVKATFFVNGRTDEHSKSVYKRIVNEGHTIGMHSYTHKYSEIYSSVEAFAADLDKIQNLIYDVTGVDSLYYRFPGGSSNQVSNVDMTEYIQFLNSQNITYFDWNVASGDATLSAYTANDLVENVMRDVVKYKTSVVLLHDADNKTTTVEALPTLIERLQAQGAVLLPISDDTTLIQHVTLSTEQ